MEFNRHRRLVAEQLSTGIFFIPKQRYELGRWFLRGEIELNLFVTLRVLHNSKRRGGIAEGTARVRWIFARQPGHSDSIRLITDLPGSRDDKTLDSRSKSIPRRGSLALAWAVKSVNRDTTSSLVTLRVCSVSSLLYQILWSSDIKVLLARNHFRPTSRSLPTSNGLL